MKQDVYIKGVRIDNVTFGEAVSIIKKFIEERRPRYVVTPNVDHIIIAQRDGEFKKIYDEASLVLADGMPILWAAKFLGRPLKEKISGSDFFPRLCEVAAKEGYRLFFLGGNPEDINRAKEILEQKYHGLRVVGTHSPPFGFEKDRDEERKAIDIIKEKNPDILFVALGAPKQEKWIYKHSKEINAPVSIGIGASFSFIAGRIKRAPRWMQTSGLEWLWRLMMEPKRLWRRYLVDDMKFFWLILKQKLEKRDGD